MIFFLNIYKKDRRTKSGVRMVGSYEYERKNKEAMIREVESLSNLYRESNGYSFEILEVDCTNET